MLRTRLLTAVILVAGLLLAIFMLPPAGWLVLCALVCALAGWEWGGLTGFGRNPRLLLAAGYGLALLLFAVLFELTSPAGSAAALWLYACSAAFWLLLAPCWLLRKWPLSRPLPAVLTGFVVLLPTAATLVQLRAISPWLLLALMAVVWVADIAAYFTGRALGRHKLAPAISPGKTWEGAGGAVLAVWLYGFILLASSGVSLPAGSFLIALGLLLWTALSIVGDLFESLLKRQRGIKDSSNLLPGHGGILDRIDSLTSTLPAATMAYLLLSR